MPEKNTFHLSAGAAEVYQSQQVPTRQQAMEADFIVVEDPPQ